jgi:hypothetical protein
MLLLILGGIYITCQLLACFLVTEPPIDSELLPQVNNIIIGWSFTILSGPGIHSIYDCYVKSEFD